MPDLYNSLVEHCSLVNLPKNQSNSGNITLVNNQQEIPFDINRVYYLFDIPSDGTRGGHAHRELNQIIIAASGSFDVLLDDGKNKRIVTLNRPYVGLHIIPGIWRELLNFSSGSVCLVLASDKYKEIDYIRDYSVFENLKK